LAISKEQSDKAAVLKMFIEPEEQEAIGGKHAKRHERHSNRVRVDRNFRNQKIRLERIWQARLPYCRLSKTHRICLDRDVLSFIARHGVEAVGDKA
jgi:hypothetical protein